MASVSGAHSSRTLLDIIPQYSKSKSAVDVGSVRLKSLVGVGNLQSNTSRFPKLEECAHFHYEHLDLQPIQLIVVSDEGSKGESGVTLRITSGTECWQIRRTFDHFSKLDEQLHQCVFDRKFSELPQLSLHSSKTSVETQEILDKYVQRLSNIWSGCSLSCGPVLSWFELDNRGRRIVASGHGINTPAVAAAFATTPYTASATDELSFQIGDMISVIDMPPAEESSWWRGKRGFVVGFFPSNCVAVITDKIPTEITLAEPSKPVLRKHGKLIAFFRAFILSRPSRRRLKQTGILKERVFGCDLSEHLLNTGREIPLVLKCCAEFIEAHGIVDGIYRLSGVTSNIQRLRSIFDEDRIPVLEEDSGLKQDVHGVASLLKMYFRELPNPLCTYQLYDEFVAAVQSPNDQRLDNMRRVVQKLPPPHYRTLEYLMGHLGRVCGHSTGTGMTARNVAIVWAPNLLRCRSLDQGVAALQGVGVQAVVTEFLILYAPHIFSSQDGEKVHLRPKSLAVSSPTKLLTLEEAMARGQHSPATSCVSEIPHDEQQASGHPSFHTVIDLPRKRQPLNWRTIFTPRRNLQPKSPRRLKRKTIILKSTELLSSSLNGERFIAQASGPSTVAHSRSVSHDSYFDTNFDTHKSTPSLVETQQEGLSLSLDLSELQMNFELEESEMRIFSEDETNQLFSSGASIAFGVLENDMNLEKRFSTQNLRYIDSYSPDPMEGDSPDSAADIQTPGYQPLLTTPGSYENLRVSCCFDSASSKKSDSSPFTYEKLMESPGNMGDCSVQRRENDLYESCTPNGGSTANVYESMDMEHEIYEPVAPVSLPLKFEEPHYENDNGNAAHYENETVVRSLAPADNQNNIYEDIRCASTADIYEQVSNFKNSVNEVNSLANESLTSVSKSFSSLSPQASGGKQYHSLESVRDPPVSNLKIGASQPIRADSPSSTLSRHSDATLCEEKDSACDKVSLNASTVQDTMISSASTMISSASEGCDGLEAPVEDVLDSPVVLESVPMETSQAQDVPSPCPKLHDKAIVDKPAPVGEPLNSGQEEHCESPQDDGISPSDARSETAVIEGKCAHESSLERQNVPDTHSRNLDDRSDEISKTYYQNFNLSENEKLLSRSSKDDLSNEPTISELTQYDCREPNLNDNLACDSNLSVDNLENICEDNNICSSKIDDSSIFKQEKSGASPQKCTVVSEVLKRDWVGRAKDGQGRSSVTSPSSPVSAVPPVLPTSEDEDKDGKAEKLKKFVELDVPNFGSDMAGARSKLKLSVGSLNREDISPGSESDLERRERIERYKEERRNFFRNKYKTDALNNNEERDEELIRRIKQKTKKDLRGMDVSPCEDSESGAESKKSPAKMTVNISYSPTKAKAGLELEDITLDEDSLPPESRFQEDHKPT